MSEVVLATIVALTHSCQVELVSFLRLFSVDSSRDIPRHVATDARVNLEERLCRFSFINCLKINDCILAVVEGNQAPRVVCATWCRFSKVGRNNEAENAHAHV